MIYQLILSLVLSGTFGTSSFKQLSEDEYKAEFSSENLFISLACAEGDPLQISFDDTGETYKCKCDSHLESIFFKGSQKHDKSEVQEYQVEEIKNFLIQNEGRVNEFLIYLISGNSNYIFIIKDAEEKKSYWHYNLN